MPANRRASLHADAKMQKRFVRKTLYLINDAEIKVLKENYRDFYREFLLFKICGSSEL